MPDPPTAAAPWHSQTPVATAASARWAWPGQVIIAAAEAIWLSNQDLGDVLFSISPILTGAGLVTVGVAIIRAGVWARPSRFLPLTLGMYTILVLIPVMIASGGPPAPLALLTIGGWDMLWFVLSASLLRHPQRRSERPGNGKDHPSYLTAHPLIGKTGWLPAAWAALTIALLVVCAGCWVVRAVCPVGDGGDLPGAENSKNQNLSGMPTDLVTCRL